MPKKKIDACENVENIVVKKDNIFTINKNATDKEKGMLVDLFCPVRFLNI